MILKAFKYRLYPTANQCVLIEKHIGSCRFVYNLALETKQIAHQSYQKNLSCFDLINQIPDLKKDCAFLKEINSQSLQASIKNLDTAFTNFFKNKAGFPKYKSKNKSTKSFNIPQSISIVGNKLCIPKFKRGIEINQHRKFEGEIRQATISKTPSGKYYVSILVQTKEVCSPKSAICEKTTIGIDLGIKDFLISSNGEKIENPRYLQKSIEKLKFLQSKYSKKKGKKAKKKLVRLHERVAQQRKDFLHKTSNYFVKNHDTICLETLKIKNMVKNHKLAQAISDVSWGMFVNMLDYKAEWYGVNILRIGTFEPSSKTCANCGEINKELTLSDRVWTCKTCQTIHDRDINAGKNIKNFALRDYKNLCVERTLKNQDELPAIVGVRTLEATIPLE